MGDDANVNDGRLDVTVIRAIADAIVASMYNGAKLGAGDLGEDVGASLGKGYAAFLKASKGEAQTKPVAEESEGKAVARRLADRPYRGFDD